ncbi:hypothetical protein TNCV_2605001 [Trichonephila clavipes]|nr:hypothetical protein TNCV_2605001 [Trichonephila clavipes]
MKTHHLMHAKSVEAQSLPVVWFGRKKNPNADPFQNAAEQDNISDAEIIAAVTVKEKPKCLVNDEDVKVGYHTNS